MAKVWSSDFDAGEVHVTAVDTGTRTDVVPLPRPEGVLVAHGAVWVALHHDGAVARIDPASREVVETIELHDPACCGPQTLAADDRYVYVGTSDEDTSGVFRIDPTTNAVAGHVPATGVVLPCGPLTVADEVVWAGGCQSVAAAGRFHFGASQMTQAVFEGFVGDAVVTDDATWFVNTTLDQKGRAVDPRLVAVDPDTGREVATAPLEAGSDVALDAAGAFWVAAPGALLRIPLDQLRLP